MYSIWAANNTDNAYTVFHAPLFIVVHMRHNKKEKKKERKKRKKKKSYVWQQRSFMDMLDHN